MSLFPKRPVKGSADTHVMTPEEATRPHSLADEPFPFDARRHIIPTDAVAEGDGTSLQYQVVILRSDQFHKIAEAVATKLKRQTPEQAEREATQDPSTLTAFVVTGFKGVQPTKTVAIVYAQGREHCKRVLRDTLNEQGLGSDNPDHWTITPLTPVPNKPSAHIIANSDY